AHARSIGGRFFAAHTKNAHVLRTDMPVRADRDLSHVGEITCLDKQSADPQHFQCFRYSSRYADALNHHVSTSAVSQVTNHLQTFMNTGLAGVDHVIGAQFLGKIEPISGEINRDNCSRSEHARLHEETHAKRPYTQDHDGVVKTK